MQTFSPDESDAGFCIRVKQSPNDFASKELVYKKYFSSLGL